MRTSYLAAAAVALGALTPAAITEVILGPYPGGFGSAVAIEGEWVAVGAPDDSKVYLFRNEAGSWNLKQTVGAIVPQAGDEFGASLAMENGWLFVGAPQRDETAGADAGAVYTFKLNGATWSTIGAYEFAGCDCDLNGDKAINQADLAILLSAHGTCIDQSGYNPAANLFVFGPSANCVDESDLGLPLQIYGMKCD